MARADRVADLLAAGLVLGVRQANAAATASGPGRRSTTISARSSTTRPRAAPVHSADAPNQLWLADITEHHTGEGKLYLCAIKDAYSNRIIGYSIDSRMKSRIAVAALNNAVARRGDVAGCVLHTDRGSQFRSRKLVHALNRHAMVGSMGRVGAAGDNAAMESFFSLLQKNVLDRRPWATREQLRIAIVTWIERTYHRRRRQTALGRLTPIEYETIIPKPSRSSCINPTCHPFMQQTRSSLRARRHRPCVP